MVAYSDMSKCKTGIVGAAILIDEDMFVDYTLERMPGIDNTYQGELLAITLAMKLVNDNFDTPQRVVIYSDCLAVVKKGIECIRYHKVSNKWAFHEDWERFLKFCGNHSVKLRYVRAHKTTRSLNMICDYATRIIAKSEEA